MNESLQCGHLAIILYLVVIDFFFLTRNDHSHFATQDGARPRLPA